MDVKRDPKILRRKRIRRAIIGGIVVLGVGALSIAVFNLKPAAPSVPRGQLWFGKVVRGSMVREVRGAGTLVPEEIRWIPATTSGRVERIVLRPGAQLKPGSVILVLNNPDLQQSAANAKLQLKSAQASLENLKSSMRTSRAQQEAAVSNAESAYNVANGELEANKKLAAEGIVPDLTIKRLEAQLNQAKNTLELAKKNLAIAIEAESSQMAPQEATVNQQKAVVEQFERQLDDLQVKSTMTGVLQLIGVEEGQQVGSGTNLARVSDPTNLKATIRISETQMRDLAIGQQADIDTRSGHVKGRVSRIDPAAQGGTVGVDITLDGELPPGARPDLSIDGVVELERLENILYVQHPSFGQDNSTVGLFKVMPNGEAVQVTVKLGRSSVQFIEVVEGLREGDEVVLSDMSQYDQQSRIKIVG
jgi:HlyD family secretion protein